MSYRVYDLVPTPMGAAEWGWDQYQQAAIAAAESSPNAFLIVRVPRDGVTAPQVQSFLIWGEAARTWDGLPALPADIGFAVLYDKSRPASERVVEQKVNPAIETLRSRQIDWTRLTPWVVAGAGVVAVALVLTRKGGKGPARRVRRRRLPTWRRRTVTVWR